jgi:hypothetical protein
MDKSEYERRSVELYAQYEAAKRANEQNPVREQRSKALKEARNNYKRKQNALTSEYETANPAVQTELTSKSSEKSDSIDWTWLWWLIPIALVAAGRAYVIVLERESQQNDPPAETLPQEERR